MLSSPQGVGAHACRGPGTAVGEWLNNSADSNASTANNAEQLLMYFQSKYNLQAAEALSPWRSQCLTWGPVSALLPGAVRRQGPRRRGPGSSEAWWVGGGLCNPQERRGL